MPLAEVLNWTPVRAEMPDAGLTVLVFVPNADEPVWLGYHDDETDAGWVSVDGLPIAGVTHWANVPAGPRRGK